MREFEPTVPAAASIRSTVWLLWPYTGRMRSTCHRYDEHQYDPCITSPSRELGITTTS